MDWLLADKGMHPAALCNLEDMMWLYVARCSSQWDSQVPAV